jgi:hypothetical protein
MKKLIAVCALALILIIAVGPAAVSAGPFESGKFAAISGYKSASVSPDASVYGGVVLPDLKNLPKATTITWDPDFMNQTRQASQTASVSSFGQYMFKPKVPSSCGCGCG